MLRSSSRFSWFVGVAITVLSVGLAAGQAKYAEPATGSSPKNFSSPSILGSRQSIAPELGRPIPIKFFAAMQEPAAPAAINPQSASPAAHGEPFPFSHKVHYVMNMECTNCHEASETGTRAGFPNAAKCMICHQQIDKDSEQIKKLAALPGDTRLVPDKPLYKLPEFVFFSHATHKAGGVQCASCHGDVRGMAVVELHMPMRMKACVDCHKENHAAVTCTTCHEAFQQ